MEASSEGPSRPGPSADSRADGGVELLRKGIDAYNRGDLGWVYEHAAERIAVEAVEGLVNTGHFTGKERFRVWMEDWQEAWSEMTIEIVNVETFDDRFLVAEVIQRGIGALSGIETTMEIVQLVEISGDEIARFCLYPDLEGAMVALERLREGG